MWRLILMCLLTGPVSAHHSLSAFDATQRHQVQGTVKEFRWSNPHTWIVFIIRNEQGVDEEWRLEGGSVSILVRNGWTWKTLNPGDRISLMLTPRKDGSRGGHFTKVTLPNGTVMPETPDF